MRQQCNISLLLPPLSHPPSGSMFRLRRWWRGTWARVRLVESRFAVVLESRR
ncbi:hypothetical protein HETIRDRAFT_165508 [Heterobasidion irregulare TC 32-1]|uniref:Uncharacterized protein n=1 Tax=Heterobasidion irregulare (strain TC 32-1) TaxID=747525 RepID=W4JZ23_HETIT|nr:uncharacterized protein HETIRDRAFT_165508 [Heterobasidion irregulare TC 32-1]ETW78320.1 hypothetical protein HETIRDRAFT_165508 [Heterobasidion irregulare TC 32-1]